MADDGTLWHRASCHCGAVVVEVEAPADLVVHECNCSICTKAGYLHLIVPAVSFRLVAGESDLLTYTFNTGVAQHHFCRHCGCRPFYIPRSNPDGVSVNVRCLDPVTVSSMRVVPFDGENWEAHAQELAHLSKPPSPG